MTDTNEAVWHTPTEYDALRHGPPYLPQRQATLKQAFRLPSRSPLEEVLILLQAAALLHQTHHWSTRGASYFADHLLFERLYTESLPFIDQVAERAIGSGHVEALDAVVLANGVSEALVTWARQSNADSAEALVDKSLQIEIQVLAGVRRALQVLEAENRLSAGISNLLEGVADGHESFVYLLRQRLNVAYQYDRR